MNGSGKLMACLLLFPLAGAAAEKSYGLIGAWRCQSDEGPVSLEFQSKNRLVYDGEPSRYSLEPGVIVVQEDEGPVRYGYTLQGDRLSVVFPEGSSLQCQRLAARSGGKKAAPSAAAGGDNAQLRGRLCNWGGASSSSSGYYRLTSMVFDGRGGVVYSSEASFSSDAGGYYGQGGGTPGSYQVNGNTVQIRLQDGSTTNAQVNMRQSDGSISELLISGKLWATGLCQ